VLGRVHRLDADLPVAQDRVDDRLEPRRDAARVRDDADGAAAQIAPGAAQKGLVAELDARRRQRLRGGSPNARRSECEAGAAG
jgi:hypothetical protein